MKYGYLIILAISLFICGCSSDRSVPELPPPPPGTARLLVTTVPAAANISDITISMSLSASGSAYGAVRSTFTINPKTRSGELLLPSLSAGIWTVSMIAHDATGGIASSTSRTVALYDNQQTRLTVLAKTSEVHFAQHEPVQMNLPTYDGSGQTTHPDVVYVPGGFGTGNWSYWMVATPYTFDNYAVENPSLYVSNDGTHWVVPNGVTNPIVPVSDNSYFNADPDMLYYQGQLWLFYKQNSMDPFVYRVNLTRSSDGIHWSMPVTVLKTDRTEPLGDTITSPAISVNEQGFTMWYVIHSTNTSGIFKRNSSLLSE